MKKKENDLIEIENLEKQLYELLLFIFDEEKNILIKEACGIAPIELFSLIIENKKRIILNKKKTSH